MPILEICANSFQSSLNAQEGGAHRIELCQNLEAGGTTPSYGLIVRVRQKLSIPIHVLIRPRTGDFVYDDDEFEIMLEDIQICKSLGCAGVVVGVLSEDNHVDVVRTSRLVQAAQPMSVTFHRAFDDCPDQNSALEDVISTGCDRILTSGGADSVLEGSARIAQLVQKAGQRITLMPGAGLTAHNLKQVAPATGAVEFHASGKHSLNPPFPSRFAAVQLQTDTEQVKATVDALAHT